MYYLLYISALIFEHFHYHFDNERIAVAVDGECVGSFAADDNFVDYSALVDDVPDENSRGFKGGSSG